MMSLQNETSPNHNFLACRSFKTLAISYHSISRKQSRDNYVINLDLTFKSDMSADYASPNMFL